MVNADAILATPFVQSWLTSGDKDISFAGIHQRSCNLVDSKGRFLTIALPDIAAGPFTMLIEINDPRNRDLSQFISFDSQINLEGKFLSVGNLTVRTDLPSIWNPFLEWTKFSSLAYYSWVETLEQFVINNAPHHSFAFLLNEVVGDPFYDVAKNGWKYLANGLEERELHQILKGVDLIAGLGIGLTPAGDDFLMGLIYALWLNLPPDVAQKWSINIHRTTAAKTTKLSAFWLEAASQGQASEPWHDLLVAIVDMNVRRIRLAAYSLTSYGHTSGFDALTGFILASKRIIETKSFLV